jgi:D-3-phosphoglycerate dehydrogenase
VTFKILICDKIADEGIELLEKSGYKITKAWGKPKDELPKIVDKYDALIVRSATKVKGDLIANAKTARVIGRAGIGLDNIDVEKAEKMGITVVNTPQATAISVAELAFGHLLALARNIVKGTVTLRDGKMGKKRTSRSRALWKNPWVNRLREHRKNR